MKRIIVLGNGNSGAQAANAVFRNIECCGSNTVEYYYEYGLHHGVTIDNSIKHSYASDMNKLEVKVSDIIISCGWAHKVPDDIVGFGNCYNIHPALLPNYRGKSPIERQIRNFESLSGITLHRMDTGYDTGPVFARIVYRINNMSENDVVQKGINAIDTAVYYLFMNAYKNHYMGFGKIHQRTLNDLFDVAMWIMRLTDFDYVKVRYMADEVQSVSLISTIIALAINTFNIRSVPDNIKAYFEIEYSNGNREVDLCFDCMMARNEYYSDILNATIYHNYSIKELNTMCFLPVKE